MLSLGQSRCLTVKLVVQRRIIVLVQRRTSPIYRPRSSQELSTTSLRTRGSRRRCVKFLFYMSSSDNRNLVRGTRGTKASSCIGIGSRRLQHSSRNSPFVSSLSFQASQRDNGHQERPQTASRGTFSWTACPCSVVRLEIADHDFDLNGPSSSWHAAFPPFRIRCRLLIAACSLLFQQIRRENILHSSEIVLAQ